MEKGDTVTGMTMEAGREMDALVAERVMGWTRCDKHSRKPAWHFEGQADSSVGKVCNKFPLDQGHECMLRYFTDIAAAWSILSAGKLGTTEIHGPWTDEQGGQEWRIPDQTGSGFTRANSAPLAICLAALRACGVEYESTT